LQHLANSYIPVTQSLSDAVGEYLTECGVYRQHPQSCDRDVLDLNP
jgi:hypothetical protein